MSINWAMLDDKRRPVPLPRETSILSIDTGVELSLFMPDAPPAASDTSGGSGGDKREKEVGGAYLTDQRLVFVSDAKFKSTVETVSIPLHHILTTKFEQPTFSSNYLNIEIKASPGGGMTDGTKAEIRIKDRPMFEFVSLLEKTRERAVYMRRAATLEEDSLPVYSSPGQASASTITILPPAGNVPSDAPPGYEV